MEQQVVLGPPGTGKTTYLIAQVQEALKQGVAPHAVGYLAFTKKAADEAKLRAARALDLSFRELPYFRTIHSLAYQELGLSRSQVMGRTHFSQIGDMIGMPITCVINPDEGTFTGAEEGDRLVFCENLARSRCISLRKQWDNMLHDPISWAKLEQYQQTLEAFKKTKYLVDFTDMLARFIESAACPSLDLLVVDEAQDLSELQWRVIDKIKQFANKVIVAGDDDQAIFQWAGASVDRFLSLTGNKKVLDQSYRIPYAVHTVAQKVASRIVRRNIKPFKPRQEGGLVKWHLSLDRVDMSKGSWLVLARNRYLLKPAQEYCDSQGYNYSYRTITGVSAKLARAIEIWNRTSSITEHDLTDDELNVLESVAFSKIIKERKSVPWYEAFTKVSTKQLTRVRLMVEHGEDLAHPRIQLSTIHGAKGGEADNVLLIPDMSWRTYQNMLRNPDEEARVLYVAITRAREQLHLLYPTGRQAYEI